MICTITINLDENDKEAVGGYNGLITKSTPEEKRIDRFDSRAIICVET